MPPLSPSSHLVRHTSASEVNSSAALSPNLNFTAPALVSCYAGLRESIRAPSFRPDCRLSNLRRTDREDCAFAPFIDLEARWWQNWQQLVGVG
ncbi:hypothetical protein N7462_006971 [Penicillium macrosclerotiorum]|uniref:uncharacterized protein n=1 Tax=Penicillium macrosclerotiorum TaxID=303699 RepID=UPI00254881CD|nr:uncharacterized protein N7462_006971 [Penicillium macrosclerotiorum]KAJ5678727.1 hypothetical protein N7462_006971 [Penicillium macrosclerotiorum]